MHSSVDQRVTIAPSHSPPTHPSPASSCGDGEGGGRALSSKTCFEGQRGALSRYTLFVSPFRSTFNSLCCMFYKGQAPTSRRKRTGYPNSSLADSAATSPAK
mmetsp:Transcript_33102/g.40047  ORF Transcript_33102/g.40047 Transcript_33102/m.40047 type:complete len:102 (+) Transcript_33102:1330-1635(+)